MGWKERKCRFQEEAPCPEAWLRRGGGKWIKSLKGDPIYFQGVIDLRMFVRCEKRSMTLKIKRKVARGVGRKGEGLDSTGY